MASYEPSPIDVVGSLTNFIRSKAFLIPACVTPCAVGLWGLLHRMNSRLSLQSLNNFESDRSWDWTKEIILITGGSSGIGAEMVRGFSKLGIKVIIWDIVAPAPDLLENASVSFYHVDVTAEEMVRSSAQQLRADVGEPSILINNAGIVIAKNILEEDMRERELQFKVNVLAQMQLVQEFLPSMAKKNHGHLVTMASESSLISTTQIVTYSSTKAAVMAFHEGVAQELRTRYNARRVRTSIIFPHYVRTSMVERLTTLHDFPEVLLDPRYVARAVVEQVLSGNGGRLVLPPTNSWLTRVRALPPWYMYYIHSLDPDVYKPRAQAKSSS